MTIHPSHSNRVRLVKCALLIAGLSLCGTALAQAPDSRGETVTWTVSQPAEIAKPGSRLALILQGSVKDGWHVYSLKQLEEGPLPLLVALESNATATAGGAVTGSKPEKLRDAAFGFDTQFYDKPFTVTVPVRLKPDAKPGPQTIPLSVRFQTCNGAVCQPPKTVHLSAAINLQAAK